MTIATSPDPTEPSGDDSERLESWQRLRALLQAEEPAAGITITDAWARATADVEDPTSAIYAVIHNSGDADHLVSASVPAEIAGQVETHTTEMDGDTMKMVHVDGYEVPANGELVLEPGKNHIMLMMIPNQLVAGEMFTATLHFEHAGDIEVMVEIRPLDGSSDMSGMSGMSN